MRIFLGIDIPEQVKAEIETQLSDLKKEYPQFSWVPPENYHITIHFFGEVQNVPAIEERLSQLLYDVRPFHLFALQGALFMQQRIVLHIEYARDKQLEQLVRKVQDDAGKDRSSKKYVPHMTIARYKIPSKQQYLLLKKKMVNLPLDFDFAVEKAYLYESDLRGAVPVYKKVREFKFEK